jgi:hypothetical protein
MSNQDPSRRTFVKKAAYLAPAMLTLTASPAFARMGSGKGPPKGKPPTSLPRSGAASK